MYQCRLILDFKKEKKEVDTRGEKLSGCFMTSLVEILGADGWSTRWTGLV